MKSNTSITDFEILDYENRQLKFIAPHVLMKGFDYKTPFLNQDLFDFYLSIDNKYRENQYLYKEILIRKYPKLFSYPTKNSLGLPLNTSKAQVFTKKVYNKIKRKFKLGINENVNYLNFDLAIRENSELRNIIRESINDLNERKIVNWCNIVDIYENHIKSENDYGKALVLLASLEIHMKSKENKTII